MGDDNPYTNTMGNNYSVEIVHGHEAEGPCDPGRESTIFWVTAPDEQGAIAEAMQSLSVYEPVNPQVVSVKVRP